MPYYGDWVTPDPREIFVNAELGTRVTFDNGITGWDVGDQNAAFDPPAPADFSSTSSSSSRSYGSVNHTEEDHPAGSSSSDTMGGSMEFLKSRPVEVTDLDFVSGDFGNSDYTEFDDSGYIIDYIARLTAVGYPATFSSGVEFGQPWENYGSGEISLRWALGFDFDPNPEIPHQMLYPGSVWRTWDGHDVDTGETASVDVSLSTDREDITFAVIPQRLITPTDSPPHAGGSVPVSVNQAGYADRTFLCQYQPNAYRLVWNDDNPPPWLRTSANYVRQRQNPAGNSGGPGLRARQNAGANGAWPLRQR